MTRNTRLLPEWYPPAGAPVNAHNGRLAIAAALALLAIAAGAQAPIDATAECSADLRHRFAPADPDGNGTFTVCRSTRSVEQLADQLSGVPSPAEVVVEDAFAGVSPTVRRRLALLYRGRPVTVVRGWRSINGTVEHVTLIAPPPDNAVTRLLPGTLIISSLAARPAVPGARSGPG